MARVRRHDLDERTFVTDNGEECCQKDVTGLWVYQVVSRLNTECLIDGQCAICHKVVTFTVRGEWPDIWDVKAAHARKTHDT